MNRLDLFLPEEWCSFRLNRIQMAQAKGISDDCSMMSTIDKENWGACPQRMLNCWTYFLGYQVLLRSNGCLYRLRDGEFMS